MLQAAKTRFASFLFINILHNIEGLLCSSAYFDWKNNGQDQSIAQLSIPKKIQKKT